MKVFMTGGTGFLGSFLTERFIAEGHSVTILTRSSKNRDLKPGLAYCEGNPTKSGPWQKEIAKHNVLINLAGSSIFQTWNDKNKKSIRNSRILSTRNLVDAIGKTRKSMTLINGSAVGYYGFRADEELDESSLPGDDFLADVVKDWEAEAKRAEEFGTRVVLCRIGVILGRDGGALSKMLSVFKWGMGSPLGTGAQWFSWIALHDLANIFVYLMENETFSGPVNCTSPYPVTNREMTKALGRAIHRPTILPPVPAFVIKGVLGEFSDVFVKGQKVMPRKLLDEGFVFEFPEIEEAFAHLLH
ncbi:MAG: epimerase [Desulfobacterales bacterium SG8_35_2]|nr:MAG: epimerase [Desulfobacterales bacterium SG8_35_2]